MRASLPEPRLIKLEVLVWFVLEYAGSNALRNNALFVEYRKALE